MTEPWKGDFHTAVGTRDAAALRRALASGLPVAEYVLGPGQEYTPLLYAIDKKGGPAVVAVLLAAGADVNAPMRDGYKATPLGLAARRGDLASVQRLLAAGADVNASNEYDMTPLSYATGEKRPAHEAVVKALLAAGARPNYQALVGAARHGSPAMIALLAEAGADVNEVSRWGTALVLAADEKRSDTVEALLRAGADPHLRLLDTHRNYPGLTALDVARRAKAKKVIAMLEVALAGQHPAAPPSAPPEDVPKLWKRIHKALKAAPAKKSLRRGATPDQVAACEAMLGVAFPLDLHACYLVHDGQKPEGDGLFPEGFAGLDAPFLLLSLDEVVRHWRNWQELAEAGEFARQGAQPDRGVRSDWWNPGWVPIAWDGGGDSLCVDLAPDQGGTAGQVIGHHHADSGRPRIAASLRELLRLLAEHLEEAAGG